MVARMGFTLGAALSACFLSLVTGYALPSNTTGLQVPSGLKNSSNSAHFDVPGTRLELQIYFPGPATQVPSAQISKLIGDFRDQIARGGDRLLKDEQSDKIKFKVASGQQSTAIITYEPIPFFITDEDQRKYYMFARCLQVMLDYVKHIRLSRVFEYKIMLEDVEVGEGVLRLDTSVSSSRL